MDVTLRVWRQRDSEADGGFETYRVGDVSPDASFLEMLDEVNEGLNEQGEEPIAFDSDCREGICGTCGLMIDGLAHGPQQVNNTPNTPRARENQNPQNKQLEQKDGERLDTRKTSKTGKADPAMATVGKVDRAEDTGG